MSSRFITRFVNRNPRNMEMLGKQAKSQGYQFEADHSRRNYIYKVELLQSKAHQEALVTHFQNGVIISASTREKSVAHQLYSNTDTCAAANLARVLALRCLQSGIYFAMPAVSEEQFERSKHQQAFFDVLVKEGLTLKEPDLEEHSYVNDKKFVWERYPIHHDRLDKLDEL